MPFLCFSLHTWRVDLRPGQLQVHSLSSWQFRGRGSGHLRKPLYTLEQSTFEQSRLDQTKLSGLRLDQLRKAIRGNRVSFPSQVPTFEKHDRPDLQRRLVQLYFVLGWSCEKVAARHGLIHQRVRQILTTWKRRAVAMGYIQYIPAAPWTLEPSKFPQ